MGTHAPRIGDFADLFVRELVTAVVPKHPHYVIRTKPRADRQVRERLQAQGFLPLSLKFFPGFIFLRFHQAQRLQIGSLPGVHSIVGFAAQPSAVNEEELEALVRAAESRLQVGPAPFPASGTLCRLIRGPLEGLSGVVMGERDRPLVVLSLTLLQRSVAVEVQRDWIGDWIGAWIGRVDEDSAR